jgi:acyl carrier protein
VNTSDDVRRFITEGLGLPNLDAELTDGYPLLERAVLDSTSLLELVDFLESRFGVVIDEEDLVPDHFGTIGDIAALVEAKRQQNVG